MATGDLPAPAPSEQVTATPPAPDPSATEPSGDERTPLAPLPQRPATAPAKFLGRLRVLDAILLFLVVVFAFEVATFRALNSDVFLHLAVGRAVAEGTFLSGTDLFTFGAERAWVNHSWLPDLIAYGIYQTLGHDTAGAVLVILKAVLVALLAGVMLRTGSLPGRSLWIPGLCVLLAILTASPRLLLQSTVLSFLLLGVTLLVLERARAGKVSPWLLPVVCLVWVNVDGWFLLGPLTIGLYLLGELLQRVAGEADEQPTALTPGRLGIVLLASVAACLINPFHFRAFALPPSLEVSGASGILGRDPLFRSMFLAPWEEVYFTRTVGLSAAGLSYFLLLLVGLVSFGLTAPRWRWWRVLVWLGFAALSLFNMRAIPFFAVVAGPITALNLLDGLARFYGTEIRNDLNARQLAVVGRVGSILAALILVLLSVPGWLQAEPHENRQLGLGVRIDEGLRDAALQVKQWRDEGALPEKAHFFNTSPDVVNYFAWFCPSEKTFLDYRVSLFGPSSAQDFIDVRKALQGEDAPQAEGQMSPRPPAWRRIFAQHDVQFLVFHSHNLPVHAASVQRLQSNPDEFVPAYLGGATSIYVWRDPVKKRFQPDSRLVLDFNRQAFGPDARPAPQERPATPGVAPWYKDLLPAPPRSRLERDSAYQHEMRFDGLSMRYSMENQLEVQAILAAAPLIGVAGLPGGPMVNGGLMPMRLTYSFTEASLDQPQRQPFDQFSDALLRLVVSHRDGGPPASLYLAIRAARRALHENPDDPETYLLLARCYGKLASRTRERSRASRIVNEVEVIRQTQVAAALKAALKLEPRPEQARVAHLLLYETFLLYESLRDRRVFEARVNHFREYVNLSRKLRHNPGIPAKVYLENLERDEKRLADMERELKRFRDQYEVQSANKPLLEKVRIALSNGLAETALAVLQKAEDIKELVDPRNPREASGGQIAVDLMLTLGELEQARDVLAGDPTSDKPLDRRAFGTHPLGVSAYDWFQVQLAASCGDYDAADKALADLIAINKKYEGIWPLLEGMEIVEPAYGVGKEANLNTFAGLLVGQILLDQATKATSPRFVILRRPGWQVPLRLGATYLTTVIQQEAELWTVRAWLSLESGQLDRAREQAGEALKLADLGSGPDNTRQILACAALAGLVKELAEGNKRQPQ